MPANRTRRWRGKNRSDPTVLTEDRLLFFIYGYDLDGFNAGFDTEDAMMKCYQANKEEIIEACIDSRPCSRPDAFWIAKDKPRPIDPLNDFYNKLAEAEALYTMGEIRPEELPHLDHLRQFYGRCRAMERDRK